MKIEDMDPVVWRQKDDAALAAPPPTWLKQIKVSFIGPEGEVCAYTIHPADFFQAYGLEKLNQLIGVLLRVVVQEVARLEIERPSTETEIQ